jgi:hypothetical protein
MTTSSSSTADASSSIADRLSAAISKERTELKPERLRAVQRKIDGIENLRKRGLLHKQENVVVTSADFEKRYRV